MVGKDRLPLHVLGHSPPLTLAALPWPGLDPTMQHQVYVIQFLELMLKQKPRVCLIGVDHGRLCNINSSSMTLDQESDDGVGDVCEGG